MSLTERERRCLEDLAQEIARDDPLLARMLTRGRWLPRQTRFWVSGREFVRTRRWWQWLFAGLVLGGMAVLLSTIDAPRATAMVVGASILVAASAGLCVTHLCRNRRLRRLRPSE